MKAEFRVTTPADAPAIATFLGRVFEAGPGEPIVDPRMMEWKYWRERPGWQGSRSYVLERGSSIVAHGAAWPTNIVSSEGVIPCFFLIDWAASPDFPGAGVSIMKHMAQIVPVNFLYGGTEIALKMRYAMGYRPRNEVFTLALPLRPVRQILTSQRRNWKTPARFARNLWWSYRRPAVARGWHAQPLRAPEIGTSVIQWPAANPHTLTLERNAELFEYLSACPLSPSVFFVAMRDSKPVGYFCLTFPPGQARIADAWTASSEASGGIDDWVQIYALAVAQARVHPGVNEITAAATGEIPLAALERCGFHIRSRDPAQIFDPKKRLPPDLPLDAQLIDGDAAFRSSAFPDYFT
jgi:hypothetical protein